MIQIAVFEPFQDVQEFVAAVFILKANCDVVLKTSDWEIVETTLASSNIDVLYANIQRDKSGLQRIIQLREAYPNLGIIVFSNFHSSEEITAAGADVHLRKPISPTILVDAIDSAYRPHT